MCNEKSYACWGSVKSAKAAISQDRHVPKCGSVTGIIALIRVRIPQGRAGPGLLDTYGTRRYSLLVRQWNGFREVSEYLAKRRSKMAHVSCTCLTTAEWGCRLLICSVQWLQHHIACCSAGSTPSALRTEAAASSSKTSIWGTRSKKPECLICLCLIYR